MYNRFHVLLWSRAYKGLKKFCQGFIRTLGPGVGVVPRPDSQQELVNDDQNSLSKKLDTLR